MKKIFYIVSFLLMFFSIPSYSYHYEIHGSSSIHDVNYNNYTGDLFYIGSGELNLSNVSFDSNKGKPLHIEESVLHITSSSFNLNSSYGSYTNGGAIWCSHSGKMISDSNVVFSSNTSLSTGGAIYSYMYADVYTGKNSKFLYNTAISSGGAIYNNYGSKVHVGPNSEFVNNSAFTGGAICNDSAPYGYRYSNIEIDSHTIFDCNNATLYGGAIYHTNYSPNDPSKIGAEVYFSSNSAREGGAIYNKGYINFGDNVFFTNNYAKFYGGAIYNDGTIRIGNNVNFSSNVCTTVGSNISGGAIFNDMGIIKIGDYAGFRFNNSIDGSAIKNMGKLEIGSHAVFDSNVSIDNTTIYGGAISNTGATGGDACSITIGEKVSFSSNTITAINNSGYGAAICNQGNIIINKGASFNNNSINATYNAYGGAIRSSKNLTICDGAIFNSNSVNANIAKGGAIWNSGTLNLIANTNNIEFTGNTANGVSNAIHNSGGTINLLASSNADIIFNDGISGGGTININTSTTTMTANGRVILNGDNTGYVGTINLYGGEIELQSKTEGNSNINTNKFFSGDINLSSGTLNILNNSIDNITVSNLTTTSNANLKFDTDLSNNTSDNFTITNGAATEILNLTAINILGINGNKGQITLFNNEVSPDINILTVGNYGGYEYTFTNSETIGVLNYLLTGYKTLKESVNAIEPTIRSYSLAEDEIVTENLGQLGGNQLTIFGNNYDINGSEKSGITVSEGQTLNIENVKEIKNFSSENHGGFINNAGTINISDNIIFSSNTAHLRGGVLYNTGTINIGKNVTFSSNTIDGGGAAIYNSGGNINIDSNISFIYNNAIEDQSQFFKGGAINNEYGGVINISSNAKFIQNSSYRCGSAISNINGSSIYIGSNSLFSMNKSTGLDAGGVIYNDATSSCYIDDNVIFSSNTGGSIITSGKQLEIGENAQFLFNEGLLLGVLTNSSCVIEKNSQFISNEGGLLSVYGTCFIGENSQFVSNSSNSDTTNDTDNIILNVGTLEIKENANFELNNTLRGMIGNAGNCSIGAFSKFSSNISSSHSGAISNSGIMDIGYKTIFSSNIVNVDGSITPPIKAYGGAIYNSGTLNISSSTKFEFNASNSSLTNRDAFGGAIFNEGICNIKENVSFVSNKTISETTRAWGGAIYNTDTGKIDIDKNVKFNNNSATDGGAIYNYGYLDNEHFGNIKIDSNAEFILNNAANSGGAICNKGNLTLNDNVVFSSNTSNYGGAVNNDGGIFTILNGAKFTDNSSTIAGGAIRNVNGTINLIANTNNVEFTGNIANGKSSAIHNVGGIINLWASDRASIIFNDAMSSFDYYSEYTSEVTILNINKSSGTLPTMGKVILNDDMRGYAGKVNLYNGTIEIGADGTLFSGDMFVDNATIDMANNVIKENNLKKLTINNNLSIVVDADLQAEEMDTMYIDSFEGDGKVNIRGVNILSDNNKNETTEILFTSSTVLKNKITSVKSVSSKLFRYRLSYNDGYFKFKNVGDNTDSNPIILESSVAEMASGLLTQTTVLNQVFSSIDNIRNRIIQAKQNGVLYASTADVVFDNSNRIESGLWIRPFMAQDTIKLDSLDVDNTLTGTLAGLDLAVGENSLVSFYLGYAGSNQKYEDIKVNQTGYVVGVTGMIIKNNWYAGLTANINFNKAESESDYGTDSFDLNMYSIGAKAGYNFEIGSNWIIEPNLTLMYGNISNQEYETTQGAKIDSQSNSNIIVEPQVKAKLDLTSGWQPYGLLGYIANISDKGKVVADEIEFETDKIDGYVEYGAGVNKEFINTPWSCYAQVTGRSGGITGVSGNLGIKYKF